MQFGHSDITIADNPKSSDRRGTRWQEGPRREHHVGRGVGFRTSSAAPSRRPSRRLRIPTAIRKPPDRSQDHPEAVSRVAFPGWHRERRDLGQKGTRSTRCVIPQSACGSFCPKVRSIFSILPKTLAHRSIRLNASMRAISRYRKRWRSICKALGAGMVSNDHRMRNYSSNLPRLSLHHELPYAAIGRSFWTGCWIPLRLTPIDKNSVRIPNP